MFSEAFWRIFWEREMKTWLIAAVLFAAPTFGVLAMNPATVKQGLADTKAWAKETFPAPKPEPKRSCQSRRG